MSRLRKNMVRVHTSLTQNTEVHAEVRMTSLMESLRRDLQNILENLGVKCLQTLIFLDDFRNTRGPGTPRDISGYYFQVKGKSANPAE